MLYDQVRFCSVRRDDHNAQCYYVMPVTECDAVSLATFDPLYLVQKTTMQGHSQEFLDGVQVGLGYQIHANVEYTKWALRQ